MRAAIVHYWLLNQRGGEKVLDAICRLLPDADIFTLFSDPATLSAEVRRHRITTSFLNPLRRWHRSLLPLNLEKNAGQQDLKLLASKQYRQHPWR